MLRVVILNYRTELDLQQRIEYLSRAIMSAKSATFTIEKADTDILHDLEEKLDVSEPLQCRMLMLFIEWLRRV